MLHSYGLSEILTQFPSTKIIALSAILYHIALICFKKKSKFELFTAPSFVFSFISPLRRYLVSKREH